jgi:hypothetical protein
MLARVFGPLAAFWMLSAQAVAVDGIFVGLSASANPHGSEVRLGDIARIVTRDAQAREELSSMSLGGVSRGRP